MTDRDLEQLLEAERRALPGPNRERRGWERLSRAVVYDTPALSDLELDGPIHLASPTVTLKRVGAGMAAGILLAAAAAWATGWANPTPAGSRSSADPLQPSQGQTSPGQTSPAKVSHVDSKATVAPPVSASTSADASASNHRYSSSRIGSDAAAPTRVSADRGRAREAGVSARTHASGAGPSPGTGLEISPNVEHSAAAFDSDKRPPDSTFEAELGLIRQATADLDDNDPTAAMRALDEHAARFQSGIFAGERDGLRVVARCRSGASNARNSGERFIDAHPASPLVDRVRRACGLEKQ